MMETMMEETMMETEDQAIAHFDLPSEAQIDERNPDDAVMEPQNQVQRFNIRLANSQRKREQASLLIQKMYGWRGYSVEAVQRHAANKIMLFAETGGETVGTMTLCLDDRECDLPADEIFRDKLDELRQQGRRLCEPSKLAIEKDVTKRVFASMIHISFLYAAKIHGFTDYIIEVNPRHVMFYKRMLGFKDFGGERNCPRVDAPAVLLRLDLSYMAEQISKWGGKFEDHGRERSFYPYFFPPGDVDGIEGRLRDGRT